MGLQNVALEVFYGGVWNDLITPNADVLENSIVITRGDGSESAGFRPQQIDARLANDDDRYRISNPMSPLYGLVGLATPCRVKVGGNIRGWAEMALWKADETPDFVPGSGRGMAWVDISGGGLLQRINQWTAPIKSPLRVATEGLSGLIGYWPLEDKAGTVYGTPVVPGTSSLFMNGHSFGSQNSPPGGGTAVDRASGADYPGFRPLQGDPNSTTGWQFNKVVFMGELDNVVGSTQAVMSCALMNGGGVVLGINNNAGTTQLRVYDNTGTNIASSTVSTAGYAWSGRWLMIQIQASYSAGTTTIGAYWRGPGEGFWNTFSTTYVGPTSDILSASGIAPDNSSFGHIAMVRGFASALTSGARVDAFESHPGEVAALRAVRLLTTENGVQSYVSGRYAKSMPMGPQGNDTLEKQLLEVRDSDDALVFDIMTGPGIMFWCRADRLNQTPALTLSATPGVSIMRRRPAEQTDDVPVHNIVTASQRAGGDFTAEDDVSAMGTQAPPLGVGPYRQTVAVNLADPDHVLSQLAYWYLNRGTVNQPRYPTIEIDLTPLAGATLTAVEAVDIGSVILITNYREYTIRLYVIGYVETINTHDRKIVFTCAPDQQFATGVIGTARLAARSTTLNASLTTGATTVVLKMTDPLEQWRTGANAVPVLVDGELITLGTVGAVTGTGPWTQTVNGCTRAVNGMIKTHNAGAVVTVPNPLLAILGEP